ncbi:MAG: ATP-grasp domain-containing protein [Candidatus Xenobia bacterium]
MHDPLAALRPFTPWPVPRQSHGLLALEVAEQFGVPVAEQVATQRRLGEDWKLPAEAYYGFRLFLPRHLERASLYVSWDLHERLLQRVYQGIDVEQLSDKWRFYRNCIDHAAPVCAYFRDGAVAWRTDLPSVPLFLKATNLSQGEGHELFAQWSEAELLAHACERSRERPMLLQPLLQNHPDNEPLAPGRLVTARIITARLPGGDPFLLQAFLRIPRGDNFMDHFARGNLAAPLHDGMLGPALEVDPGLPPRPLPVPRLSGWEGLRDACLATHQRFPDFPLVGWDAAASPDGPRLLEANVFFSVNPQFVLDEPWGSTRYVEVMTAWLT